MKSKDKNTPPSTKKNEDQRRDARKRLWMRLAAFFMVIIFLASECSTLILMN